MSKSLRVLELFTKLSGGGKFSKKEMAKNLGNVSLRTVQRYINTMNVYLEENDNGTKIEYDTENNYFYMRQEGSRYYNSQQILLISKILMASRAMNKEEITDVIENLLIDLSEEEKSVIKETLNSESIHYEPLLQEEPLLQKIWEINGIIQEGKNIDFNYSNAINEIRAHSLKPLYITFSEFYFYVVGINEQEKILIFRVDRILDYKASFKKSKIKLPYYFSEGEMKKRIYFMYGGDLKRVRFEFSDGIIESVLDRFPTAQLIEKDYSNNHFTVEVEVVGDGIIMWLLSQGSKVKILSPNSMVESYKSELRKMYDLNLDDKQ